MGKLLFAGENEEKAGGQGDFWAKTHNPTAASKKGHSPFFRRGFFRLLWLLIFL